MNCPNCKVEMEMTMRIRDMQEGGKTEVEEHQCPICGLYEILD